MPNIGLIQSTNFQSLLTELGITRNNIPFNLDSQVQPVVLVGGTVSFLAAPTPAYTVTDIHTSGLLVAPGAFTSLADTGPLDIGAYSLQVFISIGEANGIEFRWRNVADTADLWNHRFMFIGAELTTFQFIVRLNVENDGEAFRVQNVVAGNVGIEYQATILKKV